MPTQAQIQANRINAQKSTGPRTPEGKAVVAQNALKHGFFAQQAVIHGEDPGEFETYRDQMLAELNPVGSVESMLADRAVSLAWRLLRAQRLQNEAFDHLYTDEATNPLRKLMRSPFGGNREEPTPEPGRDPALGRIVVKDFANTRVLDRLLMYERRLEHSLYRTTTELQRLRLLRQLDPPQDAAPSLPEQNRAPTAPHRAKQTQSHVAQMASNRISKNTLQPKSPVARLPEQTQSRRSKDLRQRGGSMKNRCENPAGRLIVGVNPPRARTATQGDTRAVQSKGELA